MNRISESRYGSAEEISAESRRLLDPSEHEQEAPSSSLMAAGLEREPPSSIELSPSSKKMSDDEHHAALAKATRYDGDPELAGLDLLEQKTVLISRGLNGTGMGAYQWCIFFLCGYGYLLDLMWAQAFGLILSPIAQEFNVPVASQGDIFTAFSVGLTVGAFTWGLLVDIIGRRWAFNLTTLICSLFGLVIGASNNWATICVLTAFCGFGLGGNIPIDATILIEFLPNNRRFLVVLLSIFQPIGVIICSVIAWGLIPSRTCDLALPSCGAVAAGAACCTKSSNMGWRYTMYTLGGITLLCFVLRFVVFNFRESPKFLLTARRDAEAIAVVQSIAKFNGRSCDLSMEDFEALASRTSLPESDVSPDTQSNRPKKMYDLTHLKGLFASRRVTFVTLLVLLVYMADYWGFTVAGSFLPTILRAKGAARDISTYETYRNYIIISCCGVPGVVLGAGIVEIPSLGRKWSMVMTSALMAVCLFLFAVIDSQAANVAFNALEYFFQSAFNAILYGYAPELFHTNIRGSAVGLASCMGRLMSIVSPLIAAHLYAEAGVNSVLYLAGGGTFVATAAAVFLPETRGRQIY